MTGEKVAIGKVKHPGLSLHICFFPLFGNSFVAILKQLLILFYFRCGFSGG